MNKQDTWKPYNTNEMFASAVSDFNKLNKGNIPILMDYTIIGFCVMDNFTIRFPRKKQDSKDRRFVIKYHYRKSFIEKLLTLFKREEGFYEIYTEQEGF